MERKFFLDLEETMVESWDDARVCNLGKLKSFFKNNDVKNIHMFSFAIWNQADKETFLTKFKPFLEEVFDVNIESVPTLEEILGDVKAHNKSEWDLIDLSVVWGKHRSFVDFCTLNFTNAICVLLDDAVPNQTVLVRDFNLQIEIINVKHSRVFDLIVEPLLKEK